MDSIHWLEEHMLTCPFKWITGWDCPGCGMQRSFIALLKGDLVQSLILYPALLPVLFTLLFTVLHLRYKFRNGATIIRNSYIGTTALIMVSYFFRILS